MITLLIRKMSVSNTAPAYGSTRAAFLKTTNTADLGRIDVSLCRFALPFKTRAIIRLNCLIDLDNSICYLNLSYF